MRVISAYLLVRPSLVPDLHIAAKFVIWGEVPDRLSVTLQAALGGNSSPSADDINKILSSGKGRCPVVA